MRGAACQVSPTSLKYGAWNSRGTRRGNRGGDTSAHHDRVGFCWDDFEWYKLQPKHRQLYIDFVEGRSVPDRLMVVATQIEARVTFDFSLTQAARSPARGSHP